MTCFLTSFTFDIKDHDSVIHLCRHDEFSRASDSNGNNITFISLKISFDEASSILDILTLGKSMADLTLVGKPSARFSNL